MKQLACHGYESFRSIRQTKSTEVDVFDSLDVCSRQSLRRGILGQKCSNVRVGTKRRCLVQEDACHENSILCTVGTQE